MQATEAIEAVESAEAGREDAREISRRTDARRYLTFVLGDEVYGLPLQAVREIVRMPDLVEIPLAPAHVLGIANLRGSILPVLSGRRSLGMDDREIGNASRVVVLDDGDPLGILVDRMDHVVYADEDQIEDADKLPGTGGKSLLAAILKMERGPVMVLSGQAIRRTCIPDTLRHAAGGGLAETGAKVADRKAVAQREERKLVCFGVGKEDFALPVETVREIVDLPEAVDALPDVPSHVLGIMRLRQQVLPLVDLAKVLRIQPREKAHRRVVVLSRGVGEGGGSLGLVTDWVREVLSVDEAALEEVPALLRGAGDDDGRLQAICRLDEGRRLVTVLDAGRLSSSEVIPAGLEQDGEAAGESEMLAAERRTGTSAADEEVFVVFSLAGEAYGLPVRAIREIVRVPEQVTAVPNAPDYVMGAVNLRGVVIPVVDQRRRFHLPVIDRDDRQRIMVLTYGEAVVGVVVDAVLEVARIPDRAIEPAPHFDSTGTTAVERVANLDNRMILLLDPGSLVAAVDTGAVTADTVH